MPYFTQEHVKKFEQRVFDCIKSTPHPNTWPGIKIHDSKQEADAELEKNITIIFQQLREKISRKEFLFNDAETLKKSFLPESCHDMQCSELSGILMRSCEDLKKTCVSILYKETIATMSLSVLFDRIPFLNALVDEVIAPKRRMHFFQPRIEVISITSKHNNLQSKQIDITKLKETYKKYVFLFSFATARIFSSRHDLAEILTILDGRATKNPGGASAQTLSHFKIPVSALRK